MKFQFAPSKIRFWIGIAAALFSFITCYIIGGSMVKCGLLAVAFVGTSLIKLLIQDHLTLPVTAFEMLLSAFVGLYLSQFLLGEGLLSVAPLSVLLGYCCCLMVIGIFFLLIPNIYADITVGIGVLLLLSTASYFVYAFRGTELHFIDLFSVATAANVVSQYNYLPTANMVYGWVLYFLYLFVLSAVVTKPIHWKSTEHFFASIPFLVAVFLLVFTSDRVNVRHFGNSGTYSNGFILNFTLTIDDIFVEKPDDYSSQEAEKIAAEYVSLHTDQSTTSTPNIIVIMDEAYSDLSVLGAPLNTDTDISPFINSLEENTIKGYALSSAFGGRTANSEFEFLTGSTMGFLPNGAIAFQQFIHNGQYSIISQLESLSYQTVAVHPYLASGWMRNTVWPELGFDKCFFLDDFLQKSLIRGLVSDQEMVDYIISAYENRDTTHPLFLYGVTMQNHSGYDYIGEDFETTVHLIGYSQEYARAEQYLTLIQSTDKAIENLIAYFAEVEEPVVILFYGDHLPSLDQSFYEEIHGGTFETLDEQMQQYLVPFFVWANYDIEEQYIGCTSLSYLSNYLYEAAGIVLPAYNQFLTDLDEQIPSINMLGYYSISNKCFLPFDQATGIEKEWLEKYQILQYNALFDADNLCLIYSTD